MLPDVESSSSRPVRRGTRNGVRVGPRMQTMGATALLAGSLGALIVPLHLLLVLILFALYVIMSPVCMIACRATACRKDHPFR